MKTAQQIIGLPVVSIFDGNEIGKVKNVIINASKGTIDFFEIDSGIRELAGGVIPAERVLGIGEYALTIQQPDDISDIVKIPAAIELMQKNITVRGTRVLTRKGSLLGETGDIYINENDYNITGVDFIPADPESGSGVIPRSSIITFGKNLLVVQDDFIDKLIEAPNAIETALDDEKKNIEPIGSDDEIYKIDDSEFGENIDDLGDLNITGEIPPINTENQPSEEKPISAADIFEQRQKQYLAGKKLTKPIYDSQGTMIANAGEVITEQIIQKAKENGKLIELIMNYEQ